MSGKTQRRCVTVLGSINVDLVCKAARLPAPGETVAGGDLRTLLGGKGANQAIAAARAGAEVAMVGAVGVQSFGLDPRSMIAAEGVETSGIETVDGATGSALIVVDERGENAIAVSSGANASAAAGPLPDLGGGVLLAQLELPPARVASHMRAAKRAGATVALNAAPALSLPDEAFEACDVFIVNETELAAYADADPTRIADEASAAAGALLSRGAGAVILTLGARGARLFRTEGEPISVPAYEAGPVDTTGAGDCFCGVFAARLAEGDDMETAADWAAAAAAISVESMGASASSPHAGAIEAARRARRRLPI